MKRLISRLLLAAMLLGMTACGTKTPAETTAPHESDTSIGENTLSNPRDAIPVKDFGGAEVHLLVATETPIKYEAENSGDILSDAVYNRNRAVEENFGVTLHFQFVGGTSKGFDAYSAALNGSVLAGDALYDLTMQNTAYIEKWILGGMYADLAAMEHLNFEDPWWFKNVNSKLIVNGRQFACSGGYAINAVSDSWCVLYNRELQDSLKLKNPYDYVFDGKWTWDVWMQMCRDAEYDLNGDTVMDANDRYGVDCHGVGLLTSLQFGLGHRIIETDENGTPVFVGVSDRTVDIMDRLTALYNDRNVFYSATSVPDMVTMFTTGKSLTMCYTMNIIETTEMRQGPDFGILPLPKLDEAQDSYYTYCFMDSFAIPKVIKDEEMSQLVLNALNCYSYYDVIPQYKESVLQNKLTRDDESAAVIDLLLEGVVTDFGCVFLQALDNALLYSYSVFKNESWATWWAANETRLQENLNKLIEDFDELE